jgi:hypothetical protein
LIILVMIGRGDSVMPRLSSPPQLPSLKPLEHLVMGLTLLLLATPPVVLGHLLIGDRGGSSLAAEGDVPIAAGEDKALFNRIGVIFPNQGEGDRGTHVNISGAGLVKGAPNPNAARRFLEYLTSAPAQATFALGNIEYPAAAEAPLHPVLQQMGSFRPEPVDAKRTDTYVGPALQIMQRAGWR